MNNFRILVHSCCAPCSTYSFQKLANDGYIPTGLFYNPNIQPVFEYERRRDEFVRFAEFKGYDFLLVEDDNDDWDKQAAQLAEYPEGGDRCLMCYRYRLEKTAQLAAQNQFELFTTVLTISPHKNAGKINAIGKEIADKYGLTFLEENFKKKEGFKKSLQYSAELGLYRQDYCGCLYSKR